MSKYIYPALFEKDENNAICVSFPDIPGCFTSGADLQEAYDNAKDALCLMLYDMEECGEEIPKASRPLDIKTTGDAFVSIVPCDTMDYRRQYDNKAVKKTLSIPSWLNTMAEREGINFSATLQDALKQQLRL